MNIQITVDPTEALTYLQTLSRQLPFATSKALNVSANRAQQAIRANVQKHFTLRRPQFVLNTIKINSADRATKTKLDVTIRVDPERDFLAKFEAGGIKQAREGKSIAIPQDVRRNKADIIPKAQRPRALLASRRGQKGRVFATPRAILEMVGRAAQRTTRTLYLLKAQVRIPKRLGFEPAVVETVQRHWVKDMTDAFEFAERTARPR